MAEKAPETVAMKNLREVLKVYLSKPPDERAAMAEHLRYQIENPYERIPTEDSVMHGEAVEPNIAAPIHPEHRAAIKNFGDTVMDQIHYLEQRYPTYEFGHDDHNVYAKLPGHDKYFPIDPNNWHWENNPINPKNWDKAHYREFVQDTGISPLGPIGDAITGAPPTIPGGDAAFDTLSAIPKTAASMWGAAFGGTPGAMAMRGGVSLPIEAGRQAIGQAIGTHGDMDWGQVLKVGGLEGLMAGLGTGMGAGAQGMVSAEREGVLRHALRTITNETEEKVANMPLGDVLDSLGKTLKYGGVIPKVTSAAGSVWKGLTAKVTGTTPRSVQTVADNPEVLIHDRTEIPPLAEEVRDSLNNANKAQGAEAGKLIDQGLADSGGIDAQAILAHVDAKIAKADAAIRDMPPTLQGPYSQTVAYMRNKRDELAHYAARNGGRIPPDQYNMFNQLFADDASPFFNRQGNLADQTAGIIARGNSGSASAMKSVLNRTADDESELTRIGRAGYDAAKRDSDMLAGKVGESGNTNTSQVQSLSNRRLPDPDVGRFAKNNMTPDEYEKYRALDDALHANLQYHGGVTDVPMGSMSAAHSAGIPAALKSAPAQGIFRGGAKVLGVAQRIAEQGRAYGSTALSPMMADRLQSLGQTADPEEQVPYFLNPRIDKKQRDMVEQILKLGATP